MNELWRTSLVGHKRRGHSPTRGSLQNIRCRSKEARARPCRGFATCALQKERTACVPTCPRQQTDTRREMKQIRASGGNNCPPHTSCCFDSRATRMHHFFIKVFPICHRNSTFGQASPGNNSNSPKRAWRVLAVVLFITTSSRKLHVEHLGNGLINCHTTPRSVTRHHRDRAGHFCVLLSDTQSRAWNSIKPVHQDLPGTKSTGASGCWQSYLFKTLMYLSILSIFLNRQRGG